jgi:hypothetical protein
MLERHARRDTVAPRKAEDKDNAQTKTEGDTVEVLVDATAAVEVDLEKVEVDVVVEDFHQSNKPSATAKRSKRR